jgi:phosphoribosyl 1,2-cyclic phosphate phosphodiesterase
MMKAEFLFLGTGGSSGIPMIGCSCLVCTSKDPRNKRLRPSALVSCDNKTMLIDAGPDFRFQALRYQINRLDGLLLTHSHFDHIAGLDELRIYYLLQQIPLPVLLSKPTYLDLKRRYDYLFREKDPKGSLTAQFDFHVLSHERGKTQFLGFAIGYMHFEQAGMPVLGFRFGSLAYLSDIRNYPETLFEDLEGINILIVSALRNTSSNMHFNLDEAIAFARRTEAEMTYFTHMSHELEHQATQVQLPEGFNLAYDGLKLNFEF